DFLPFGKEELAKELHERIDLVLRASPVLLAEGVERQRTQAQAAGGADDPAGGMRALPVAAHAAQVALLRPTAVAIHDDADVGRKITCFDERHEAYQKRARYHEAPAPATTSW